MGKLIRYIRRILVHIPDNDRVRILYHYFLSKNLNLRDNSGKIVAVQCVELPLYYAVFGQIILDMREKADVSGRLILVRSLTVGNSLFAKVERSQIVSYFVSSQWARAFKDVVGSVAYRSQSFNHPLGDLFDVLRSYITWRDLIKAGDVSKLTIKNILVGDLIIDSYLRFRPSPRFQVTDSFVWRILWQSYRDIRRARKFFLNSRPAPALYLSSYSSYIQHGVPVRVALNAGVPVYVFGSPDAFCKKLTLDDMFHVSNEYESQYKSLFEQLPEKEDKLREAENQLRVRLSGGVDAATSYMKVSAYAKNDKLVPDIRDSVVVYLHDFCDSPNIFDDMVFSDFWDWIVFTIETLTKAGIPFYIKPHPNQLPESADAVKLLIEMYPTLRIIPTGISSKQLVSAGMICGITVYGTIAHELAYMGIPSISCARHPHHSFEFSHTAKTITQYKKFIENPKFTAISVEEMRRQALAFYYMHNIYDNGNSVLLKRQLKKVWIANENSGEDLLNEIKNLQMMPEYRSNVIEKLLRAVAG
jgi:hypothetical protein